MPVRRLVTANDVRGESFALKDGPTPGRIELTVGVFDELWSTDSTPPNIEGSGDPAQIGSTVALLPKPGGVTWRCTTFAARSSRESTGSGSSEVATPTPRLDDGGAMEPGDTFWHTTKTLDFGVVISGRIILELDDGAHELGPGDCVVQRGTRHRWMNPTDEPCVMSFVMVSAEPIAP